MLQGEESLLAQRVRSRHEKALSDFITSIREINADHDQRSSAALATLKSNLEESSEQRTQLIQIHRDALESFRETVESIAIRFSSDPRCPLLEDDIHTAGEDSFILREERVEAKRREVLLVGQECFRLHGEHMQAIADAQQELLLLEQARAESTRSKLDLLGSNVAAAAFVNETELQVIVQGATHSVNRILLQNQVNINSAISSCRQMEFLSTRESLSHVADLYNDQLIVIQDSMTLWTVQYLSGPVFHSPSHRQDLLRVLGRHASKIKGEVQQCLRGLSSLAETLTKTREECSTSETCGGTASNGWLRFYDPDYHHQLFSKTPHTVSKEWETFVDVIVNNAKCSALELLQAFGAAEERLVEQSHRVKEVTDRQLTALYTLTADETSIIRQCCLSDEFRFPLNTIHDRLGDATRSIFEMSCVVDPLLTDIKRRGEKFVGLVADAINTRTEELAGQLSANTNSVLSYVIETTSELELTSTRSLSKLRKFWLFHEESSKDFEDVTRRLENEYTTTTNALQRAGTISDADLLFTKGMGILNQLEESYHSYHNGCVGPMEAFMAEVTNILAEDRDRILGMLLISHSDGPRPFPGPGGEMYYVADGDWRYPSQIPAPVAPVVPPTPDVVVPIKKGKPQPKKSKDAVDAQVIQIAKPPVALVELDPVAEEFRASIAEVLTPECLFAKQYVFDFLSVLQTSVGQWVLELESRASKTLSSFCKRRRDYLNRTVNELIRRHQRRAPSLQSGMYELRVRELQTSQQNRRRQLESFEHRMGVMVNMIEACLDDSTDIAKENVSQLDAETRDVRDITTRQVLETHNRAFADLVRKMKETIGGRKTAIGQQLRTSIDSIMTDCDSFRANGMRTFEEGGSITEVERRESLNLVGEFLEKLSMAEEGLRQRIDESLRQESIMLSEAWGRHEMASEQCSVELAFFASVNVVLSEVKGKVYNLIMANENANGHLDGLISSFEASVRDRDDGENYHVSFSLSLQSSGGSVGVGPVDYVGMDEDLSSRLRQTQADTAMLFQESRAQRILEAMLSLRLPLFDRGLILDVLKNRPEMYRVSQEILVDPTDDIIDILLTAPVQPSVAPLKKGRNPKELAKQAAAAAAAPALPSPSTALFVSADGFIDTVNDCPSTRSSLVADMQQLCADAQQRIDSLISSHLATAPVIRDVLGGSTSALMRAYTAERMKEHFQKIVDYTEDGRRTYREQVQRVFIAVSDASEEMFRCLQSVCAKSLSLRLEDVLGSFYTYYTVMLSKRGAHNQRLKGCLAAPSNRSALCDLVADEDSRQEAAQHAVKTMWAVALREIQSESRRMALRCLVSLQSFFWLSRGLVSPEHLVPGGAAALGDHKGLRRLLRKGEINTQSNLVEVAAVVDARASQQPPIMKGDKGKKVPVRADAEAIKHEMAPLDLPLCDYAGVDPHKLKMFDQFIAHSAETGKSLVNHYLLPSQWRVKPVAEVPPTEVKKDSKGKKLPPQPPAVALAPPQEPVVTCAYHRAPSTQLCKLAYYSRERAIDMLRNSMQHAANDATKHFAGLLLDERQWAHSWNDAIARL